MSEQKIVLQTDAGEVWLRWSSLSGYSEEQLAVLRSTLSVTEHLYVNAAVTENLKISRLIGRGVLREELSQRTGLTPAELQIETTEAGKPFLSASQNSGMEFSLSRSGEYILHAFSEKSIAIGIDLEKIDSAKISVELVAHALNSSERRYWSALEEEERLDFFFRTWVYKEAVLKADGCGLSGLNELSRKSDTLIASHKRLWQLEDIDAPEGYYSALATPAMDH